MGLFQTKCEVDYPDSDGEPVGESDWHIDWTFRLRDLLKWRYRDQQVYVGSDLIIYYEAGEPLKSVVPDGFVVLNHSPHRRRIYKTWEEGRAPDVAFEFTSLSSKRTDVIRKPQIYAELGVKEYFVYDPEREYLKPPLQGFRLAATEYVRIEPDSNQALHCHTLGLKLCIHNDDLLICDLSSGTPLTTAAEAEAQRAEAEVKARKSIEAEVEQLRADLRRLRGES